MKKVLAFALALSMLLASLGTSAANVALPDLAVAFGATFQAVQWVVLAYLLAITTLIVNAVNSRDYALIQGVVLFSAVIFVFVNLVVDIAYMLINPRVNYESGGQS